MKVWWCQQHEHPSVKRCTETDGTCRMVEMQLVPADARVVSRDALVFEKVDGEWPDGAIEEMETIVARYYVASAEAPPPKDPWDYDP